MAKAAAKGRSVEQELADTKAELATVHRFLDKVQKFSDVIEEAKTELFHFREEEEELDRRLKNLREKIRVVKDQIACANDGMLAMLEPGPVKFMPLFDKMEKASTAKHGQNASKWRELPVSSLRLSPSATTFLYEAELLFIGQLQDRILESPETWWEKVSGLTAPIAAAIADKLSDFVSRGGAV